MDIRQLKAKHEKAGGKFFDHEWMRLFDEDFNSFGVAKDLATVTDCFGNDVECFRVTRNAPNKRGISKDEFFSAKTFEHIA